MTMAESSRNAAISVRSLNYESVLTALVTKQEISMVTFGVLFGVCQGHCYTCSCRNDYRETTMVTGPLEAGHHKVKIFVRPLCLFLQQLFTVYKSPQMFLSRGFPFMVDLDNSNSFIEWLLR